MTNGDSMIKDAMEEDAMSIQVQSASGFEAANGTY